MFSSSSLHSLSNSLQTDADAIAASGEARQAMTESMAATLRALSALVRVGLDGQERPPALGPRYFSFIVYTPAQSAGGGSAR